jgi:hypothetical protein
MILWYMRGYTDPDGEFEGGEMVCAIEHAEGGYQFLVWHDGEVQVEEHHGSIDTARGKADMLKTDLLARGWLEES